MSESLEREPFAAAILRSRRSCHSHIDDVSSDSDQRQGLFEPRFTRKFDPPRRLRSHLHSFDPPLLDGEWEQQTSSLPHFAPSRTQSKFLLRCIFHETQNQRLERRPFFVHYPPSLFAPPRSSSVDNGK